MKKLGLRSTIALIALSVCFSSFSQDDTRTTGTVAGGDRNFLSFTKKDDGFDLRGITKESFIKNRDGEILFLVESAGLYDSRLTGRITNYVTNESGEGLFELQKVMAGVVYYVNGQIHPNLTNHYFENVNKENFPDDGVPICAVAYNLNGFEGKADAIRFTDKGALKLESYEAYRNYEYYYAKCDKDDGTEAICAYRSRKVPIVQFNFKPGNNIVAIKCFKTFQTHTHNAAGEPIQRTGSVTHAINHTAQVKNKIWTEIQGDEQDLPPELQGRKEKREMEVYKTEDLFGNGFWDGSMQIKDDRGTKTHKCEVGRQDPDCGVFGITVQEVQGALGNLITLPVRETVQTL